MIICKLDSFPIEQERNITALEERLGGWFAGLTYPVRLLAFSTRFELGPARQALEARIDPLKAFEQRILPLHTAIWAWLERETGPHADPWQVARTLSDADRQRIQAGLGSHTAPWNQPWASPDDAQARAYWQQVDRLLECEIWPRPWLQETARFYQELQARHLRSATYLLLAWPPSDVSAASIIATLRHVTGRPVTQIERLPALLTCAYRERMTRLVPDYPGAPFWTVLQAYDLRGEWDATTLHTLLDVPFDLVLAVDVETLPRNRAMRLIETSFTASRLALHHTSVKDARSERVLADAEYAMHALTRQSFHFVQIALLVSGETEAALETNVAEITGRVNTMLKLTRVAGTQGEVLKLFGPGATHTLDAPLLKRNLLSNGVGCLAGVLGYHRSGNSRGLLWGLDALRRAPLFYDLFADNQAAHSVVLGKTGYGKTFFMNVMTLRAAALAGYRIIGVDAFRNGYRVAQAIGAGAVCHPVGTQSIVNILDIVFDQQTEGGWVASQVQHVIGQLALLLGTPGRSAEGKEYYLPRVFSNPERGVLDRALSIIYAPLEPQMPLADMPTLADLIAALEQIGAHEAHALAYELRMTLCGSTDPNAAPNATGRSFIGTTTVDWLFGQDVNYFDLSEVSELLRPFYYAQLIGAIYRFMRTPRRDVSRKTLVLIDEFGYASQVEAVAQLAATICKVARKYGIGLMVIDQNPITFLDSASGRAILENAAAKIMFHLDDLPARQMGQALSDLTEAHIDFLSHARVGECVAVFGNDVYVVNVESSPREQRVLMGS